MRLTQLSKRNKLFVLIGLAVLVTAAATLVFRRENAGPVYATVAVDIGSIRNVVNATGTVQPTVSVQIGSQISGQVLELYADFNSAVKRGQLLAKIDPRNSQTQLENAQAGVAGAQASVVSARARLATSDAALQSAAANLRAAGVDRDNTAGYFDRAVELSRQGLISKNDFDTAKANADTARAKYEQAQAAVSQADAQKSSAAAQVDEAKAQLSQSQSGFNQGKINLGYTSIYSPVDGVVVSRNVDVGQTIAASLQSPTLFTIANDLTKMRVNANVDEADIGSISEGDAVRFAVDAYPGDAFSGRIYEIRLNPSTIQNVVTYTVILDIANPDLKLKPGMTANITITIDRRNNVLRIPNSTLRYTPAGMQRDPAAAAGAPVVDEEEQTQEQAHAPRNIELAPGQKWNPADKLRVANTNRRSLRSGQVWVVGPEGNPEIRNVVLGITDGVYTEVVSGQLKQGEEVITGEKKQNDPATAQKPSSTNPINLLPLPRVPGGGRGRGR